METRTYSSTKQVDEDLKKLRSGLDKLWTQFDEEADWPDWWPENIDQPELDALKQSIGLCVPSFGPVLRDQKNSREDRMADMVLGLPFTSNEFPWPRDWPLAGKGSQWVWADGPFDQSVEATPLVPYLQVGLTGLSERSGRNVGDGILQIWQNPRIYELLLRIVPRESFMLSKLTPVSDEEGQVLDEALKARSYDETIPKFQSQVIEEWEKMGIFTEPMLQEIFCSEHDWLAALGEEAQPKCARSAARLYRSTQESWDRIVAAPANNVRAFGFADTINHDYLEDAYDRWRLLLEFKDDELPWTWASGRGLVYFREAIPGGVPLAARMSNVVSCGGIEIVCTYQRV